MAVSRPIAALLLLGLIGCQAPPQVSVVPAEQMPGYLPAYPPTSNVGALYWLSIEPSEH